LKYRLIDTKDLVQSLKPFAEGKKFSNSLGRTDAQAKIGALQAEVTKIEQTIKSLSIKHGIESIINESPLEDQNLAISSQ
jgi:hypothetical protein